jgi:hypothetical protein
VLKRESRKFKVGACVCHQLVTMLGAYGFSASAS